MARVNTLRRFGRAPLRILLVDDDAQTRAGLAQALVAAGFETREEASASRAERALQEFSPELIVLEAALPDGDGFELARRLNEHRPRAHLIFLTSCDRTEAKVEGLTYADDYLVKPVNRLELLARLRAILRRVPANESILRFSDVILNTDAREVSNRGELVELTPREFDLLRLFMLNPGRVLSKQEILDEVWGEPANVRPAVVETYVGYLRRKLDASLIHTVRLAGYALRDFTNR
jgi:two-component system, OmpR family, response regulator